MAPAQVLPNGAASDAATMKKQKLIAAGKDRLAAYRREKALEKERKAAAARQSQNISDSQSSQTTQALPASDPDDAGPSRRANKFTSGGEAVHPVSVNDDVSSNGVQPVPLRPVTENGSYVKLHAADQEPKLNGAWIGNSKDDCEVSETNKGTREESRITDWPQKQYTISEPNYFHKSASHEKDYDSSDLNAYSLFSRPYDSQNTETTIYAKDSSTSLGERKFGSSFSFVPTPNSAPSAKFEPLTSNFLSDRSFSDQTLADTAKTIANSRKSRPSFLDNIKVSSPTPFPSPVERKQTNTDISDTCAPSNLSKEPNVVEASNSSVTDSTSGKSIDFPVFSNNGSYQFNGIANGNWREYENTYQSVKQNEDFSALEQHIEDLTQEKFSLQRAVEASRALAESLAAENSALTDSYNQQASVVNQLKSEMEMLQEVIQGKSLELESIKCEFQNALLECNAADERAKLLASEVISLEEKVLRLRSNELKLERQLENTLSEVSSLTKKISSLERERQDFHASISAFQEEKKMLQSKLRKLSPNGSRNDSNNPSNKQNASTSTDDIAYEDSAESAGSVGSLDSHTHRAESSSQINDLVSSHFLENGEFDLQPESSSIPGDQMGVVQNINALLSELANEKEELIRTLKAESSECSKFKELNKELTKRLEIQTQRLELLTAQNMAGQIISTRQPDIPPIDVDNRSMYADEGDEVVERVLGWIMKLFPGGPSKRRTSTLI